MKKTLSQSVFQFNHSIPITKNASQIKKVEGIDTSTASKSKIFTSKVQTIKNKPKQQTLEDQYVSGLQDEIHYLEMELKLLKEKEIAKHSQVDQLQTFFGDGIPINENILGMKNEFNNINKQAIDKIRQLQAEVKERQNLLESLKTRNNQMSNSILTAQQQLKNQMRLKTEKKEQLIKDEAKIQRQISSTDQELRNIRNQNRKLKQKISTLNRNKEINMIIDLKYNTHKYSKLNNLRQQITQKQKQFQKLQETYEEMRKQEENQEYVLKKEEQNLRLKKKKVVTQKQYHALIQKINEKKIQLEIKLKERLKEINGRIDVESRLDKVKENIERENGLSVEELEKIAKEREVKQLGNIVEGNRKLSHYVDHYSQLLSKIEENIQQLGVRRPDLRRQIQVYQNQIKHFESEKVREKQREFELYGDLATAKASRQYYKCLIPEIGEKNSKNSDKIKLSKQERERIVEEIKPRQKQLQLIEILKSFNLEEVELCNSSNMSVQQILVELMRNWDMLSKK